MQLHKNRSIGWENEISLLTILKNIISNNKWRKREQSNKIKIWNGFYTAHNIIRKEHLAYPSYIYSTPSQLLENLSLFNSLLVYHHPGIVMQLWGKELLLYKFNHLRFPPLLSCFSNCSAVKVPCILSQFSLNTEYALISFRLRFRVDVVK